MLRRNDILDGIDLPPTAELIERGRGLAQRCGVTRGAYLRDRGVACEADAKRAAVAQRRITQHAQIGYRDAEKSRRAWREIYETCRRAGVSVERYGICLDWTMGLPRDKREGVAPGTGLILEAPEDFARLTTGAPVAPHFGDFVMGMPAAVENTVAALGAGATSIGNLGQYYTFRLPHWDDEAATTAATVTALGLCAAQPCEILIHSNLDDGFAATFDDLGSSLGMVLIEQHIVGTLLGGSVSHCWGHHFSDPVTRLAFHLALSEVAQAPGSMVYGNTVSYTGGEGANHASLASYLLIDILGQTLAPSGHAINPVPVRENECIPDIGEVIEAQLFAGRLVEHAGGYAGLIDTGAARAMAEHIIAGGRRFRDNVLVGFNAAGIDIEDAAELLLALKRTGARRLEALFGAGGGSAPVPSAVSGHLREVAAQQTAGISAGDRALIRRAGLRVVTAATDVHEHAKMALDEALRSLGVTPVDGGVSVDAGTLAGHAASSGADAVMLSTYNGIALRYFGTLKAAMGAAGCRLPVLIGGRLNQIPDNSNTSLPVDVSGELAEAGAIVCASIADAIIHLKHLAETKICAKL